MRVVKTLRLRFALWTASLLLAALVLFGLLVYGLMSYNLLAVVDQALQAATTQLIEDVEPPGWLPLEDVVEEPQYERLREQGVSVRVQDPTGASVQLYGPYQRLLQPVPHFMGAYQPGYFTTISDANSEEQIRIYAVQIVQQGKILGFVQIAHNLNQVKRTLRLLLITLIISGPLMIVAAGGSGYFLAARALRPIDEITCTARAISAQDLSARLQLPATEDEVGRLATTFNSMLGRLENAFYRERQFTADASHELRTPLAAMQTIISSTLTRSRTPADYTQALVDLGHEVERMRTLTEGLLQIARSDTNEKVSNRDDVDVTLLLKDVIDSLQPLAADKGVTLIDKVPAQTLLVRGDSDGLIRLFVNLVDNAIKYTEQGNITIAAEAQADHNLLIRISDTGIGIAQAHLPYIFDRFYQADRSRSAAGAGLGLSIAKEVTRSHGGEIMVESVLGKGTTFTVRLPR